MKQIRKLEISASCIVSKAITSLRKKRHIDNYVQSFCICWTAFQERTLYLTMLNNIKYLGVFYSYWYKGNSLSVEASASNKNLSGAHLKHIRIKNKLKIKYICLILFLFKSYSFSVINSGKKIGIQTVYRRQS